MEGVIIMLLSQMAAEAAKDYKYDIILANVNGRLTEISDMDITDEKVEFITVGKAVGNEAYKRSVLLLMLNAIHKLDTDNRIKRVTVEFSLSKGLYCDIKGDFVITQEFLNDVKELMRADVKKNLPIKKQGMKTSEAIKLFKKFGMEDKTQLFKYRISSYVNVYSIEGYYDYFYGYMAANTGILKTFDIFQYDKGFVLQLPTKENPEIVPEFAPQAKLFNVLMDRSEWADMLGVDTVASLNKHIISGDINSLILVQEALQEQKIVEIVNQIKEREGVKFIMIAGPSSSGKTTFSHRLSIQLRASGFKPHAIGVDNYFVEREQTPVDENGEYNFEDIHAIDIKLFNDHMNALLRGEKVEIPQFNFLTGRKEYNGEYIQLGEEDILVIEGIHCLNDELSYALPVESKFKIYISALTQLNVDENGEYNFEDIHAIDIKLFNDHMNALLRGEKVEIPQFNFLTGRKEYNGEYIQLGEEDILVIEGIHCLNDELSYALPVESKFKIYISALTQLNVDEHNRVATTDGRLIRRMARDYRTRGASAKKTLSMWESVRKGEEKNIFPYQEEADVMFNSALAYELCVLKPIVEPLLFSITEDDPEYQEAKRLLKFLAYFLPCQSGNVPINSIMREFIGGGCFRV